MKQINVDSYFNGFNEEQMSCTNLTIAASSGSFSYDNYFFYCFYSSLQSIWGYSTSYEADVKKKNIFRANMVLKKLGLHLVEYDTRDYDHLIKMISNNIISEFPTILILNHKMLHYTRKHLDNIIAYHPVIVNGYDDKNTLMISDTAIVDNRNFKKYINCSPMFNFYIRVDDFRFIWEKTMQFYKCNNDPFYNKIYVMKNIEEPQIKKYVDLLYDILNKNLFANDSIIEILKSEKINIFDTDNLMKTMRKYINYLDVFFTIIKTTLSSTGYESKILEFDKFTENYRREKGIAVSKIMKFAYANKLTEENKNVCIKYINTINGKLQDYIDDICRTLVNSSQNENKC